MNEDVTYIKIKQEPNNEIIEASSQCLSFDEISSIENGLFNKLPLVNNDSENDVSEPSNRIEPNPLYNDFYK